MSQQSETFTLSRILVDKVVQVLGSLPWNQVAQLMNELGREIQSQQTPSQPDLPAGTYSQPEGKDGAK